MKSTKFSKKNLDDETADLIDSKYPAELDVDRIFKKSYQGFLRANVSSDTEDEKIPETIVESSPVEVIHTKHRFAFFTLSKVCAALCGVMAITAFYALLRMSDHDIETPDDINKIPIVTDNNNISTNSSHMTTTQPNAAKTDSAETTTAVTSVFTSNSSTENTSSVKENTTTEVIETTESVQVTDNPEPTSAVPATTTLATTTTALTTTTTDTTTVTTTNTTTATTISLPVNSVLRFNIEGDTDVSSVGLLENIQLLGATADETIEYKVSDEKIGKITYTDNTQVVIDLLKTGELVITATSSNGNMAVMTLIVEPIEVAPIP